MFDLFSGLDWWLCVSLILALVLVLSFEFINGFHDTANAVATVIYTKAMPPHLAVIASGIFNFLGVLLGGVGVAYAIVHLLPVELLIDVESGRGIIMVFALLLSAIIWNLGTWYFGIPASSSHTLIGAILGVGLANALLTEIALADGVNWKKAIDIAISLVCSPIAGFVVAGLFLLLFKRWKPQSAMHTTPDVRKQTVGKKHPPFWNRLVLVLSAMGVSFVHGSNDGQKGIGLIMLALIGIVPASFVLDLSSSSYSINRTHDAALQLELLYQRNSDALTEFLALENHEQQAADPAACLPSQTNATFSALQSTLAGVKSYQQLAVNERADVRRYLLCLDNTAKQVAKLNLLSRHDKSDLERLRKDLTATTEYSPLWVIIAVALALGLGTMVGWRRVVVTVGEKIGKGGMTYAQGMSAQITAVLAIGAANLFSLPVSTTHVLSSGVAGTMVANKSGLQSDTVKTILMAWALTLPASMLLSAALYALLNHLFLS